MKDKIFNSLKQEYASLGLGDELLKSQAETLVNMGFVTDENIEQVTKAQAEFFKNIQRAQDKRVANALNTANANLDKVKKELSEGFEKRIAELLATKKEEEPKLKEEPKKEEEPKAQDDPNKIPDWFKAQSEQQAAKLEDMQKSYQSLMESINALKQENDAFKAEKLANERSSFIKKTALELGVPEWRINEGFNFGADATEETIKESLNVVANNIKTQLLPQNINNPLASGEISKDEVNALADSLIRNL